MNINYEREVVNSIIDWSQTVEEVRKKIAVRNNCAEVKVDFNSVRRCLDRLTILGIVDFGWETRTDSRGSKIRVMAYAPNGKFKVSEEYHKYSQDDELVWV
ncbi:hypothetical protein HYT24_02860 [Candidatus Pacearchaeota archaeon]|nr:hypothetical protein [Candidatus Pacearchaeota archaeon]